MEAFPRLPKSWVLAMSTITQLMPDLTPPPYPVKRFTVDEYHRMIDAGVFADDDRFELLEGWIIPKMPRNPRHDAVIAHIGRRLLPLLSAGWHVRTQSACTLIGSEPEPDLLVAIGEELDYIHRHPGPADIALVIEVSDSSLDRDRGLKARIYARAGIPCYWIVNLAEGSVEVRNDPTGPGDDPSYRSIDIFGPDGMLPIVLDGREVARVAARDVLP
jgi:Uma2 family endonuclease